MSSQGTQHDIYEHSTWPLCASTNATGENQNPNHYINRRSNDDLEDYYEALLQIQTLSCNAFLRLGVQYCFCLGDYLPGDTTEVENPHECGHPPGGVRRRGRPPGGVCRCGSLRNRD
ncbi:hypothetical protein Tco_0749390 [Tanacetum coccineum]|uniref:Uncharacterized protein n=1 Tax=Tanacetum coccineum TaxID=301880 RepID=A0ABQ4YY88_9ASTR